jgi:hypothetical protein
MATTAKLAPNALVINPDTGSVRVDFDDGTQVGPYASPEAFVSALQDQLPAQASTGARSWRTPLHQPGSGLRRARCVAAG